MKFFAILAFLACLVILCDKFKENLPTPIKQLYALWEKFSHILGSVMSFLILTILWVIGFGVYGIIMKIITIPKRFAPEPNTYWVNTKPTTADSMKRQF